MGFEDEVDNLVGGLVVSLNGRSTYHRYRERAEECRRRAEKSISLLDREAWLNVAEEWLKLARETDMREV